MKLENIKLPIGANEEELFRLAVKKARLKPSEVKYFKILKKSLDARDKNDIKYVYGLEISDREETDWEITLPKAKIPKRPVIVGFGPAGMFCALYLARAGYNPIVIERGLPVDERKKSVNKFINEGKLDENSNMQFGEGGAGAFSDGKLNTGVSGVFVRQVLADFKRYGAPPEIEWEAKPHIGSDLLPEVVKNIRKEIEALGGKVLFSTKFTGIRAVGGLAMAAVTDKGEVPCDDLILAIGHSARDTFSEILSEGIAMEPKAFAIGFRIEHLQEDISVSQYGEKYAHLLPPADYRLSSRKGERGVFTFCMCPGGYVMPSSSEYGGIVTNGMSLYKRDGKNANSAVLCEVYPSDFESGVLGGVKLQQKYEEIAYNSGGKNYYAPVQKLKDFFEDKTTETLGRVKPTYPIGYTFANMSSLFNKSVTDNLKSGIKDMGTKLKGFSDDEAILTGVETRSSSPVRILRNANFASLSYPNLYPIGEGCGYAGGITSAAVDGIKAAKIIAEKYDK